MIVFLCHAFSRVAKCAGVIDGWEGNGADGKRGNGSLVLLAPVFAGEEVHGLMVGKRRGLERGLQSERSSVEMTV